MRKEKKLLELEKEIHQVNRVYKELVKTLRNEEEEQAIDFEKIAVYSKNKAYTTHYITKLDADIAYKYCRHLTEVISLLQDKDEKTRQYYFVARIAAAAKEEISFEDLVRDARLISTADLEVLAKALDHEGKLTFLINLLLMISFHERINDAQLDFFCEVVSFFGVDRETLRQIIQTVKGLLTGKEVFYDCADTMPLNEVSCFLEKNPYDYIVNLKAEVGTCPGESVIVCGVSFEVQDLLIDNYKKKHITFRNCRFEKISTMISGRTEVEFVGCKFVQCFENRTESAGPAQKRTTLFSLRFAKIVDCSFEDCEVSNKKGQSVMLNVEKGEICGTTFKNCSVSEEGIRITGEDRWSCAAVVRGSQVQIKDCHFVDCSAYSHNHYFLRHLFTDNQCMHIVTSVKGAVENCRFENCKCHESNNTTLNNANRHYYIVNNIRGTEKDNVFVRCDAVQDIGSIEWK
ncbi:MAG: hypothetical protein IKV59_03185 [Lachnospiraceae bacterium]|nr:hypothetical protein [Lachnospiraceae bacterium]